MNKRDVKLLKIFTLIILGINLFLLVTQIKIGSLGRTSELASGKSFANALVGNLQELAQTLGVAEKGNIKQAMAKLHYDVYLVSNQAELAEIMHNSASKTRDLIFSEYARLNADEVLAVLNNAQEVTYTNAQMTLTVEPLPAGGFDVRQPNNLREDTLVQLKSIQNLFSQEALRDYYELYRHLSTFKIMIENGVAQVLPRNQEQQTYKYLEEEIQVLRAEYAKVNKIAGFAEITGPGIIILVYDQVFSLSAGELRRIVGELYSSGAVAIGINGQRLAVNSYIIDSENGILVDGIKIKSNPVTIQAIGDPTTLAAGVDLLFSVSLKGMLSSIIQISESIFLPAKAIQ